MKHYRTANIEVIWGIRWYWNGREGGEREDLYFHAICALWFSVMMYGWM